MSGCTKRPWDPPFMQTFYVAHMKGGSQGLLVHPDIGSPLDLDNRTFGTPFGSTAHYHMLYLRALFPDVQFDLVDCNADCIRMYNNSEIDGAFLWGGNMVGLADLDAEVLVPAQILSDWEKTTFNTISVRDDFASRRPDVVERIAGVVARLDADYLDKDSSTRWDPDSNGVGEDAAGDSFLASVAAAYLVAPGAAADVPLAEREAAAGGLGLFEFVDPTDTEKGMLSCNFLGVEETGCTGTAAALQATAEFLYSIGNIASRAPTGTGIRELYLTTTNATYLKKGLAAVPTAPTDATDAITSIPKSADSTCSGRENRTAANGTLTDGAVTSYSDNLECEWHIESSGVVELSFDAFRVWTGDFVEVLDSATGDLVAKLHGFNRTWPPLRTTGDMTVKFTTDGKTERALSSGLTDGWNASYDAAASARDAAYCGAHGTCGASGLCTCDAGYGGGDCSLATCLGTTTLTGPTDEFRSSPTAPDRDEPYPNSAECHFVADVGTSFGYVSFTVTYDVEPTFDFVSVNSGDVTWARLSGEDTATILVPATDGKASLVFTSDSRGRRGGFRATYVAKSVACASNADCGGHGTCDDGGTCVCDAGYGGLACTVPHCLDRARAVTGESMVMVSQAPGEPVPAAADCTWEFQAAAGRSVRVVVETLDLETKRSDAKIGDKVVIRSAGATDQELTSTSFRKSYDVASSGISLSLETDRNDVGKTYGGFKAPAYAVDACPVVGGKCLEQGFTCELTSGLQGPGCYDGGRAVGCACDLTACLEGSFFDESTGGCEACPPGTFKSAAGDTPCEPCPANFYAPESGAAMCCRRGRVLVDGFCRECGENVGEYELKGATCDAAGGYGDGLCYTHAHGPLCMLCEEDYFRDNKMLDAPSKCVSCDRTGVQMRQLYTVLLMIVLWAH